MLMSNQGKIHGHHDFRFTNAYTFGWSMGLPNHHWTWIIIGLIIFIACSLPHGIWKCLKLVSVDIPLTIRVNLWFKASFYISRKIAHAAIWFHVPCSHFISCNLLRHKMTYIEFHILTFWTGNLSCSQINATFGIFASIYNHQPLKRVQICNSRTPGASIIVHSKWWNVDQVIMAHVNNVVTTFFEFSRV